LLIQQRFRFLVIYVIFLIIVEIGILVVLHIFRDGDSQQCIDQICAVVQLVVRIHSVEQLLLVQHFISEDPEHKFEVVVPDEQHPADILTQTPSYPDDVQVSVYEHEPRSFEKPDLISVLSVSLELNTIAKIQVRKPMNTPKFIYILSFINKFVQNVIR
jgi:hypothetical protein